MKRHGCFLSILQTWPWECSVSMGIQPGMSEEALLVLHPLPLVLFLPYPYFSLILVFLIFFFSVSCPLCPPETFCLPTIPLSLLFFLSLMPGVCLALSLLLQQQSLSSCGLCHFSHSHGWVWLFVVLIFSNLGLPPQLSFLSLDEN